MAKPASIDLVIFNSSGARVRRAAAAEVAAILRGSSLPGRDQFRVLEELEAPAADQLPGVQRWRRHHRSAPGLQAGLPGIRDHVRARCRPGYPGAPHAPARRRGTSARPSDRSGNPFAAARHRRRASSRLAVRMAGQLRFASAGRGRERLAGRRRGAEGGRSHPAHGGPGSTAVVERRYSLSDGAHRKVCRARARSGPRTRRAARRRRRRRQSLLEPFAPDFRSPVRRCPSSCSSSPRLPRSGHRAAR